jgi:hypothetical protein
MHRRYVWSSTRMRDLLDSLYRGYRSGTDLIRETAKPLPEQAFAVGQPANPHVTTQRLLDGQHAIGTPTWLSPSAMWAMLTSCSSTTSSPRLV